MEKIITVEMIQKYQQFLYEEEKSKATIEKYTRDLNKLLEYAHSREITKALMIEYKEYLVSVKHYKVSSINSFLVAANQLFEYLGWYDVRVKIYKVQQQVFYPDKKCLTIQEYKKLVIKANEIGNIRLSMLLQTICSTGIRISELPFVTVESVKKGILEIYCKGKIRQILIPTRLQKCLLLYIYKQKIVQGIVFRTSNKNAMDRSNIWREMKSLCKVAKVEEEKVFPHNLRHLFAQVFYEIKKDIAKLADVLGHSNIETTRIYIKTSSKEHQKQLEKMELVLEQDELIN